MVKRPKKTVEFQVLGLFPCDSDGYCVKPKVSYIDDAMKIHTYDFGFNSDKVFKRIKRVYGVNPLRDCRERPEDFKISFSVNQRESFVVKLLDKKFKKRFTLEGSTYEGVGASEPYFFNRISQKTARKWMKEWGHVWRKMFEGTSLYQDILFGKKRK